MLRDGRDVRVGLEDLDIGIRLNIAGAHFTCLIDADDQRLGVVAVQLQRNLLQVEDDVGGIFHDAGNRRELVEHTVDLHCGDRGAFNR